jgi:shikimate kinase
MGNKIVLTGFMATGKSSVGEIVARRLGLRLVDSDQELAARAGKSIGRIFAEEGEPRFRALEREVIADLAADPEPTVIATGGGALVDETNYCALSEAGVIVCLSARPEVIAERVKRSGERRPKLFQGGKPLDKRIAELLEERRRSYARAAIMIDTSDLTVEQAAERVLDAVAAARSQRCGRSA